MAELGIDDRETRVPETEIRIDLEASVVGTAPMQERDLPAQQRFDRLGRIMTARLPHDAAHSAHPAGRAGSGSGPASCRSR